MKITDRSSFPEVNLSSSNLSSFSFLPEANRQIDKEGKKPSLFTKLALLVAGLSIWYSATGKTEPKSKQPVDLPNAINVLDTDLFKHTDEETGKTYIRPSEIDFSKDFTIQTERYKIIKEDDFIVNRMIGHLMSVPTKLFFWDTRVGWGLDAEQTKTVVAMLENNPEISGITVRINHNGVFHDCMRIFVDEEVVERNNVIARVCYGLPVTFLSEVFAEFRRGDYYNPMTQTAILYSGVSSISAHEIGHHQDFQRFNEDWYYSIARALPPVMLYQEWVASQNAEKLISPEDKWQYYRYLMPAFATYILASYGLSKKFLTSKAKAAGESTEINSAQILRHMATTNSGLHAGILAYGGLIALGMAPVVASAGFVAGFIGTQVAMDAILENAVPYQHDKRRSFNFTKLKDARG